MILGSMALTAFIAVIPTVEFSNFIGWLKDVVTGWGVPVVVWAVVSAFVAQLWFAWRNKIIVSKAVEKGIASSSYSVSGGELY